MFRSGGGWRFVLAGLGLAAINAAYSLHFIVGLRAFDTTESAFVSCLGVVVMPAVMLALRRRVAPQTWLSVALSQIIYVFAIRHVPAENATVINSLKLVFTLIMGVLVPAGLITRIELSPRVIAGTALVVSGSLAQMLNLGGRRK